MEINHYLLAQNYNIASALTITKDDQDGITAVTTSTGYFRTKLASTTGVGTEDNPYELIYNVQSALGAKWVVSMISSGKIRIQYVGTGTGELIWTSVQIRALLGFDIGVGPLATNAFQDGAYLPTHCIFSPSSDDQGWQQAPGKSAVVRMPDGTTYGWQDGYSILKRNITFTFLPRDEDARTLVGASGTQVIPTTLYRINPAQSEPYQEPPWSTTQTVATAAGKRCAFTDRLPEIIAGTHSVYDVVYLDTETFKGASVLSRDGYDPRRNSNLFALSWVTEGNT